MAILLVRPRREPLAQARDRPRSAPRSGWKPLGRRSRRRRCNRGARRRARERRARSRGPLPTPFDRRQVRTPADPGSSCIDTRRRNVNLAQARYSLGEGPDARVRSRSILAAGRSSAWPLGSRTASALAFAPVEHRHRDGFMPTRKCDRLAARPAVWHVSAHRVGYAQTRMSFGRRTDASKWEESQ